MQNCLNESDMKFVPVFDNFLFGIPNSVYMIFAPVMRLSANNSSDLFLTGNML